MKLEIYTRPSYEDTLSYYGPAAEVHESDDVEVLADVVVEKEQGKVDHEELLRSLKEDGDYWGVYYYVLTEYA